nr:hypothetical protein [Tanacetum cinerariifolium]
MQTQTSNTLHNAIMEAGGKDRPPMLAPGNYIQWKSRIKRYINTKPNHELMHYCLKNPPYKFTWADKKVLISEGSFVTTTKTYMETYKNVSQDIRDQLNAEAEAVQIILTGGESINVQDLETNLYWEFRKFASRDGESLESYYSRFYKMMNELIRNQCDVTNHQVNVQFLLQLQPEWQRFVTLIKQSQELRTISYHKLYDILKQHQNEVTEIRAERIARTANPLALVAQQQLVYHPQNHPTHYTQNSSTRSQQAATRNRRKAIVNSPQPIYDQEPSMIAEDDEMSKDKEIDKLMALISLSLKKIYKPTNNNLRISSNTSRANQDNSSRINRSIGYDNQRLGNVAGARKTVGTTELEAHYMYMAQIQEVSPDLADSGPIFDAEPLQKNDDDNDLANERELLASLIKKLKCEIDDSKNHNKFLETSNKVLVEKLKGEIEDFKNKNKSLESSNNRFKEANNKLSETNKLMYNDFKKSQAELERRNDVEYASKVEVDCAKAKGDLISYKMESQKSFNKYTQTINDLNQTISEIKKKLYAHQETISILSQQKEAQIKLYKTREDKELDKVIALENKVKVLDNIVYKTGQSVQTMNMLNNKCRTSFAKPEFLKKAQRANPRLYDIGCYNDNLVLMLAQESDEESFNKQTTLLEKRMDESIPWDQKCKSSKELFKIKRSVGMNFDRVERCKETIAKRTYFSHIDPFIQNTNEANFSLEIQKINADLEKFHVCLKDEMVANLRYFNSLELEVDSLKSQLETQKTQFLNEIDRLSKEYYYADHMNAILGVYTELDKATNLQCKPTIFSDSLERKDFSMSKSVTRYNVSNDFSNLVTVQILPLIKKSILKNTNVLASEMYKLNTKPTQTRTSQLPHDSRKSNKRVSFSTGVIPTTSVSRPKLKSNLIEDRVLLNNSQGKKPEVEDHHRNVIFSKNKTFVAACNDSLNVKTSNVTFVCATYGKYVLNDKHDMCVLKSIAKPLRKPVASESNQKPRNSTREIYERISKACSWWYLKFTPSGYKWKPKSGKENVNPNLVEIVLFIIDFGCSKNMTRNLKLLVNFVEKFLGTVKFRNDQFAHILGYRDLVQGAVFIKRVYYVEGLNHNLFSVGSRGTDLYLINLQDTTSPNPICLMAKATSSQAWLWHHHLSHLNFDTVNLLSKNDIVVGLPKLKFIKDHLYSSLRIVQTDKGTEFLNQTLHAYFAAEGILHQTSVAPTPEQNGVVERRNRTLVEAARTMLSAVKVPLFFWAEAITTACFTQNCSIVNPRHEKTPYHIIN